ncbi:isatin hydrolase, partial [Hyalella azteca]|uniref:Isatin hydrolase n=1 Tax=Hyalella azteca TaxID=294128 RepID=A0A8B7P7D3_HYAAZ
MWLLPLLTVTTAVRLAAGQVELVELSYTYLDGAPTSPKLRPLELNVVKKGTNKFGIWVELNEFCSSEHSGTHIDAPVHFSRDGWSVDEIPVTRLYRRPGVMVDVSAQASKYQHLNNHEVGVRELERWEAAHGVIPDGAVVVVHTGWGRRARNITAYAGTDELETMNFPGLSLDAARWLAGHGHVHGHVDGIVGVGIDTLSLDVGSSV